METEMTLRCYFNCNKTEQSKQDKNITLTHDPNLKCRQMLGGEMLDNEKTFYFCNPCMIN